MRILVGIDQSDRVAPVLSGACQRLSDGDSITVAVVAPTDEASMDELEMAVSDYVDANELGATVTTLSGHPGSELVELAERKGFDRLVIDGGRRSPLGKIQLAALTEFVLLNATMTVTLIR